MVEDRAARATSALVPRTEMAKAEPAELDLPRLLLVAMVPYSALTAVMHPLNVMKVFLCSPPACRAEHCRMPSTAACKL